MKMKKISNTATVANMLRTKPGLKAEDIVKKLKVSKVYAYNLLTQARKKMVEGTEMVEDTVKAPAPAPDTVNHPAHYKTGGIETIDFIEAKNLNYHLGNVVKYITRADSKGNRKEDLLKAQWYLNREIEKSGK